MGAPDISLGDVRREEVNRLYRSIQAHAHGEIWASTASLCSALGGFAETSDLLRGVGRALGSAIGAAPGLPVGVVWLGGQGRGLRGPRVSGRLRHHEAKQAPPAARCSVNHARVLRPDA